MPEKQANPQVERMRAAMPISQGWAYFDHAAVSPLPQQTTDTIAGWLQQASLQGDTCWPAWAEKVEETRRLAAEMLNSPLSSLALVPSTTFGLNVVARGLDW